MARARRLSASEFDALLAVGLAIVLVAVRGFEAHGQLRDGWLGYVLSVIAALMLVGRRRWPLAVFAGTLLFSLVAIAAASPTGAVALTVVIAVYTLAQVEERGLSLLLAVFAGVSLALARGLFQYRGWSDARTAVEPAVALAALFLGWAVSSHRAYIAEIEARAAQAERTREEEARRQVDAERLRIARELHDVLAHGIATINVQAGSPRTCCMSVPSTPPKPCGRSRRRASRRCVSCAASSGFCERLTRPSYANRAPVWVSSTA